MIYDHACYFEVRIGNTKSNLVIHTKSDYITETDGILGKYNGMKWSKVRTLFINKGYEVRLITKMIKGIKL